MQIQQILNTEPVSRALCKEFPQIFRHNSTQMIVTKNNRIRDSFVVHFFRSKGKRYETFHAPSVEKTAQSTRVNIFK